MPSACGSWEQEVPLHVLQWLLSSEHAYPVLGEEDEGEGERQRVGREAEGRDGDRG